MRLLIVAILLFFLGCDNQKKKKLNEFNSKVSTACPDNGMCLFTVDKNSSLYFKTDDLGAVYPEIKPGEHVVLTFEYERDKIPNVADSGYREQIYLEINSNKPELELKNIELESCKTLFARLCFCPEKTGYYFINKGELTINKIDGRNNNYKLNFNFKINEVPQVISSITEKFTLN